MSGRGAAGGSSFPLVLAPVQARLVARRGKTQLRRSTSIEPLTGRPRPCGLKAGSTYRVQEGEGGDDVARIVVSTVVLQRLGDMTDVDAQAEGHESLAGFADWWLRRHDHSWPPQEEKLCRECHGMAEYTDHEGELVACTVCDLGVVMGDESQSPAQVCDRFARFAGREVWVVTFGLDDRRFLHRHSQRGYTSDPREAMAGEPEVIGEPLPRWRVKSEASRRRALSDQDDARLSGLPTIGDQLEELKRLAVQRGVDIGADLRVIEQRKDTIARKVRRDRRAA